MTEQDVQSRRKLTGIVFIKNSVRPQVDKHGWSAVKPTGELRIFLLHGNCWNEDGAAQRYVVRNDTRKVGFRGGGTEIMCIGHVWFKHRNGVIETKLLTVLNEFLDFGGREHEVDHGAGEKSILRDVIPRHGVRDTGRHDRILPEYRAVRLDAADDVLYVKDTCKSTNCYKMQVSLTLGAFGVMIMNFRFRNRHASIA